MKKKEKNECADLGVMANSEILFQGNEEWQRYPHGTVNLRQNIKFTTGLLKRALSGGRSSTAFCVQSPVLGSQEREAREGTTCQAVLRCTALHVDNCGRHCSGEGERWLRKGLPLETMRCMWRGKIDTVQFIDESTKARQKQRVLSEG